jgi:hypothetical protein
VISHHSRVAFAALAALIAASASAADAPERGPHGGHVVDAAGKYHLELVANGRDLILHVSDAKDRKVSVTGASARATVISAGGKGTVELSPAGENVLKGTGTFASSRTMKVDVVLTLPGGAAPVTAKFQPLAATGAHSHEHKGHRH